MLVPLSKLSYHMILTFMLLLQDPIGVHINVVPFEIIFMSPFSSSIATVIPAVRENTINEMEKLVSENGKLPPCNMVTSKLKIVIEGISCTVYVTERYQKLKLANKL